MIDFSEAEHDLNIDTPSKKEIIALIKGLKWKAPGQNNLSAELFKTDAELPAYLICFQ